MSLSLIEQLRGRNPAAINAQIEEAKKTTDEGQEHIFELKNFYDKGVKDVDAGYIRLRILPSQFNKHPDPEFSRDIVPVEEYWHDALSYEDFVAGIPSTKKFKRLARRTNKDFVDLKGDGVTDPMQEYLNSIYALHEKTGQEESDYIKYYRSQKAKSTFFCNAYIEECATDPSQEGKVVIFKFGPAVMNAIKAALKGGKKGKKNIPALNVFSFVDTPAEYGGNGASLMIQIHNDKAPYPTYVAEFDNAEPLQIDGEDIDLEAADKLYKQTHDLFKLFVEGKVTSYENAVTHFQDKYGFAHDKYIQGAEWKKALKADDEVQNMAHREELVETPAVEEVAAPASEGNRAELMAKFAAMRKAQAEGQ